jgi:hypothetical protein
MKTDLKAGQILYDFELKEYKISKIGNIYFECEHKRGKFTISNLRHYSKDYNQDRYQLYLTMQEVLDIKEIEILERRIRQKLKPYGCTNIPLEKLKLISDILEEI